MGGILGACLGSCAATCACKACESIGGAVKDSRIPYLLILFVFSLVAGILRYFGEPLRIQYIVNVDVCVDESRCYGIGAVYRLTFCAFLFFAVHACMLSSRSCVKRGADTGFWIIKLLVLAGLLILSFVLPPQVFDGFRWVSLVIGGIFMIVQIIILIDFAYSWNEDWLTEEKNWKVPVLVSSVVGYVIALIAMILLFVYFATSPPNGPSCGLEQAFIGITIGLTLLFTVISVTEWCEHGAILPSSVCTVYCYWVLYSALSENPSPCNSFVGKTDFQVIMGFVLAAASVAYAAFTASANTQALSLKNPDKNKDELLDDQAAPKYAPDQDSAEGEKGDKVSPRGSRGSVEEGEVDESVRHKAAYRFQLIMASGACYACMLLTDWGEGTNTTRGNPGMTSVWIQIGSQWIAALLYTWSLVAPYMLRNREF